MPFDYDSPDISSLWELRIVLYSEEDIPKLLIFFYNPLYLFFFYLEKKKK